MIAAKKRIYHWALHQKIWRLYFLTTVIIGFLCFVGYYSYWWFETKIEHKRQEIVQLEKRILQVGETQKKQKKNKQIYEEKQHALQNYTFSNASQFGQEQLSIICTQAKKVGVKVTNLSVQKEKNKEWYRHRDIELGIKGTLAQIIQFLKNIAQEHKLMQCKSITCHADQHGLYTASCKIGCVSLCNKD